MSDNRDEFDGVESGTVVGLDLLDPAILDKSYWARFRVRVMTRAADELFRRRLAADVSVVSVVEGWSRALVPAAAAAAVLVGLLLVADYRAANGPADVEEILLADLDDPLVPTIDGSGATAVRFASEGF
jgi:hypothetical protein